MPNKESVTNIMRRKKSYRVPVSIKLPNYEKMLLINNRMSKILSSKFNNKEEFGRKYKRRNFNVRDPNNVKNVLYIANKIPQKQYFKLGVAFDTLVNLSRNSFNRKVAANKIKKHWKSMFYINPKTADIEKSQLGKLANRIITTRIRRAELMNELKEAIKHRKNRNNNIKNVRINNIKNFLTLKKSTFSNLSFGNGLYIMAHSENGKTQYKYFPKQEKLVVIGPNSNVRTHTKVRFK